MWGVSGMQVHEIRGYGLVYKEVAKLIISGKAHYFWSFGNPTFGDPTGSNWTEKDQVLAPPRSV